MPIRLTCPSCSAVLSVKDELAGRAVKCPKCGGVIPASAAAAAGAGGAAPAAASPPAPAPAAAPAAPAAASAEKPADDSAPKRITAKPVSSKSKDDDEDDRPKKKNRDDDRDDDRDDRKSKSKRDDDDDRPKKKKRRDDRDDDDRPSREKKGGGSGVTIVLIICGTLLLICGGGGVAAWYFISKGVEKVEKEYDKAKEDIKHWNPAVHNLNYNALAVGSTTRSQAEFTLGNGTLATGEDITRIFGNDFDAVDTRWMPMVVNKRAVMWRNGDDYILAAFHPNTDGSARLMLKEWHPKSGLGDYKGETADGAFLQKYPVTGKKPKDPPIPGGPGDPKENPKDDEPPVGPVDEISAADLAQDYRDNTATADAKYKNKWFVVEGKVDSVMPGSSDDTVSVRLMGVKKGNFDFNVFCTVRAEDAKSAWDTSRGQTIKLKGKGLGSGTAVNFCRIESKGADPLQPVTIGNFLAEFNGNAQTANEKYKDKDIKITNAKLESISGNIATFTTISSKGLAIKLRVTLNNYTPKQTEALLKSKQIYTIRATGALGGLMDGTEKYVQAYNGYVAP